MKEYVAGTGGRYTYVEDIINLQELALSITSIFNGSPSFILSGCEINGSDISAGYVWINGKIRYFDGCVGATFPYYIYEQNNAVSVQYANAANKTGRNQYLCVGGTSIPTAVDQITGAVPQSITITADYVPRLKDKFIGRHALLLDSPATTQTLKKNLAMTGSLNADGTITSKTSLSAYNAENTYVIKSYVKKDGSSSIALYNADIIVSELVLKADGSLAFMKGTKELASLIDGKFTVLSLYATTSKTGSIYISDYAINNIDSNKDDGSVNINSIGYGKSNAYFRNFNVYDGKQGTSPIFQVVGQTKTVNINGVISSNGVGKSISIANTSFLKTDMMIKNFVEWTDSAGEQIAYLGYNDTVSFDFAIKNIIGNIVLSPTVYVDVKGDLKVNGESISSTYLSKADATESFAGKVNIIEGKGLSTNDFTNDLKTKLDSIKSGEFAYVDVDKVSHVQVEGYASVSSVVTQLASKANKLFDNYTSDEKKSAAVNLDVYLKGDADKQFGSLQSSLQDYVTYLISKGSTEAEAKTLLRSKIGAASTDEVGTCVSKTGNLQDLTFKDEDAKKLACGKLGAAYATDYQTKLADSGWKKVTGTGKMTNNELYARQIGNIVSIQGKLNTNNRENISGTDVLCELPNGIGVPVYSVGWSKSQIADTQYNRGVYLAIDGGSKKIVFKEMSGADNWDLSFNLTYFV